MTRALTMIAGLTAALFFLGCASSVDSLTGLPHRSRHRPPPELNSPPPMKIPSALTDPASAPPSPDARPTPAATGSGPGRVASLPRSRWLNGAMAFQMAMGARHQRRIPVIVLYHRPRCPYSRALDQLYLLRPEFARATRGIIKVAVNTRGSAAERTLTDRQKVTGTPTLMVYPGRGGRPREVIVFYRIGPQIRRKPLAQVLTEIRRYAYRR